LIQIKRGDNDIINHLNLKREAVSLSVRIITNRGLLPAIALF
jgi:hypothetical protein